MATEYRYDFFYCTCLSDSGDREAQQLSYARSWLWYNDQATSWTLWISIPSKGKRFFSVP